ncbi:MAG: bshC [Flaviaesturariibacter sp.]|nr:bshC [Flaviaesturariibacter sp.]
MFAAEHLSYADTGAFTRIVLDYIEGSKDLEPFYAYRPTLQGLAQAMELKKAQPVNRAALVEVLKEQYGKSCSAAVQQNIEALLSPNTFTICTAHQPNLFTGPLYFIYKILHAIKLAAHLNEQQPGYRFVPIYYMGSEDADLAELNHFSVAGKKYTWQTEQTGAVGRMRIDKMLTGLLTELQQQLGVAPHGPEIVELLRTHYVEGTTVQEATFGFVDALFGKYGLIVLIADDAKLKRQLQAFFEADLFDHVPAAIVTTTCKQLETHYKVQAYPREINLFYLKDNIRERIERKGAGFCVCNTDIYFEAEDLRTELYAHPERFSPNVILRGLYQETILPNIAFIGGGGELAYWLQLKDLFQNFSIPFPVLVLRNSLLIVNKSQKALADKLGLNTEQLFDSSLQIMNDLLEREGKKPQLSGEVESLKAIYETLKKTAAETDVTLRDHVEALQTKAVNQIQALEKKMLRSERKKAEATQRQLEKLKDQLFPKNGLQERVENISGYYAQWERGLLDSLLENSLPIDARFTILTEINQTN